MSRFLLLTFIAACITACDLTKEKVFLRSYVMEYYDAKGMMLTNNIDYILIEFTDLSKLGDYASKGTMKNTYDALCEKHNDMTYNREFVVWDGTGPHSTNCLGIDFVSIHISSDADFDTEHSAGEPLDNIVSFFFLSLKPYIDSGYTIQGDTHDHYTNVGGLLSELSPDKLTLMGAKFNNIRFLRFNTPPTLSKTHTFTVTMTADDGRVFRDDIEMTFE